MDDSTPPVPWHLLGDPLAFFALDPGFDRAQLKRAYKRLALRFRPEQAPEEFQKIRGAYEILERSLRHGASPAFGEGSLPEEGMCVPPGHAMAPAPRLQDLLSQASPESVFAQLASEPRSPECYLHLGLLSDLVTVPSRRSFPEWIAAGLRRFPYHGGLTVLLAEYCNDAARREEAEVLVLHLAEEVRDVAAYGSLTEVLWQHLVRTLPFARFETLFHECLNRMHATGAEARAPLLLAVLRAGLLSAPEAWVERQYEWLQENCYRVPDHVEEEFDSLDVLRDYRARRAEFLDGSPWRTRLDEVLNAWTGPDRLQALAEFRRWQEAVRAGTSELFSAVAFPARDLVDTTTDRRALSAALAALDRVAQEAADHYPQRPPEGHCLDGLSRSLARRLEQKATTSWPHRWADLLDVGLAVVSVAILAVPWILLSFFDRAADLESCLMGATGMAVLCWLFGLRPCVGYRIRPRVQAFLDQTLASRFYRPEVARLITDSGYSLDDVLWRMIAESSRPSVVRVLQGMRRDPVMELVELATV